MEALMGSRSRVRILNLLLLNPGRRFYVREIERLTGENINSIRRELKNLEGVGLLKSEREGTLKYYSADQEASIYPELRGIFLKTLGAGTLLGEAISGVQGVEEAFIYGSYARGDAGPESDIDLIIIGEVDEEKLVKAIREAEKKLRREINHVLYTPREYREKKERGDPFLINVLKERKTMLVGDESEL